MKLEHTIVTTFAALVTPITKGWLSLKLKYMQIYRYTQLKRAGLENTW